MNEYKFNVDWFSNNIGIWTEILSHFTNITCKFLEIGCYEGRATTWLLDNILKDENSKIDVIDTFMGSSWESGMNWKENLDHNETYQTFINNIKSHKNKVNVHIGKSCDILKTLQINSYDFIYIDGSHRAEDVLSDAILSHQLLKLNGILIFDDYGWKDPKDLSPQNSPQLAIECFYNVFIEYYKVIYSGYQICLQKIKD